MHTSTWTNKDAHPMPHEVSQSGDEVRIHHNGDYSGEAIINVPLDMWDKIMKATEFDTDYGRVEFKLPCNLLASFGQQATCDRIVGMIEDMQ